MGLAAVTRQTLLRAWTRRGVLAWLLWPASCLYRLLWLIHRRTYRIGWRQVQHAAVPVIVVGNVVAGGAGKTPVVLALVAHFQLRGLRPGVVARGYGRRPQDCRAVLAQSHPDDVGDEPLLIHRRTGVPVYVAATRFDAAHALLAAHPDVDLLIADDGLQHLGLHRDIEICVFDERGVGNGFLLPAGPLREPWPRPVDLVLHGGSTPVRSDAWQFHRTLASHAIAADGTRHLLSDLQRSTSDTAKRLWAVAGTARPESFFSMLRGLGLHLDRTQALADHATFDACDWADQGSDTVLCTEKDAVKLWRYRPDALAVPLLLHVDPGFWHALDRLVRERAPASVATKLSSGNGYTPS